MYTSAEVVELYRRALRMGNKEQAAQLICAMAEVCPYCKPTFCGQTHFCPDCHYYGGKVPIPGT